MIEGEGKELLISKWFPITEVSVESVRERSTGYNPPTSRIHVWFARRPHATSRAAVLGSLMPCVSRKEDVLKLLGIPLGVDVRKAEEAVAKAKASGRRLKINPFSWEKSFKHSPTDAELSNLFKLLRATWKVDRPMVVDPMAGGGSIPFEASRLGLPITAGDINPVSFICLKGTIEYPERFGKRLIPAVENFCKEVHEAARGEIESLFPKKIGEKVHAYLWARTIKCSSCGLIVPLSPNWWIVRSANDQESIAVKLEIPEKGEKCSFKMIHSPLADNLTPDIGTVKGGRVECPRCHTVMEGTKVKIEATNGRMGHQMFCVCAKKRELKEKIKWDFRKPTDEEEQAVVNAENALKEKLPAWVERDLVPSEIIPEGLKTREPLNFGILKWSDFFEPRQLLVHLTYLEKFIQIRNRMLNYSKKTNEDIEFDKAVLTYAAMVFDTCVNYNCMQTRWAPDRVIIKGAMDIQAFPFRWSYAEWNQLVSNAGYDWALAKVLEALNEIIELLPKSAAQSKIYLGTATKIPAADKSFPCIVVDPPYAENVMYAEVSDFFYVWLKRLLGKVFPEAFAPILTEKDEEAVANPARFKDRGTSAKKLALEDYGIKMQACFKEMYRVLEDDGVMTVMFTHRTSEAWSSLASALMNAGFTFVSSWPVHTEPSDKYGKKGKGVLKVTVLLTCQKRRSNHPGIWEHIVDDLKYVAKNKIEEFSEIGINGPDLKVSVYGPVLGRFADYYPVKTATGREITPKEAIDIVADVLNERFLQEADIQNADKETAAYLNLIATFPAAETEYEEARIATVFGGGISLEKLDVKGGYGIIEKKGKAVKILSSRDRHAKGIIDPFDVKAQKTMIDYVHIAILQYERGGLIQLKRLMKENNLDISGSPFPTVLQAYTRYADTCSNENFQKDAAIAKALLVALGKSIDFAPKQGEKLDHYVSDP